MIRVLFAINGICKNGTFGYFFSNSEFLTLYFVFQNSPGVLSLFQVSNPEPSPTSDVIQTPPPMNATVPTWNVPASVNVTMNATVDNATAVNITAPVIRPIAFNSSNATVALQASSIIVETSGLPHGPLITVRLESGAMLRLSWLLEQGQSPSFTINTDTEGIVYTLDSPSRNLNKNSEVTSPLSYNESGGEGGLYTLRLKNTGIFSNGVITHVVPNASDIVLNTPVPVDPALFSGPSSSSQSTGPQNRTQPQTNETQPAESSSVPQPLVDGTQSSGPQNRTQPQTTGTETPAASIAAFSGVFAAGITAGTTIYVHKKEEKRTRK